MSGNQHARVRCEIRFESKWVSNAGFFAGLSIFLLCVSFFGLGSLDGAGTGKMFLLLVFPLILLAGFGILLQGFKAKAVQIYGVIGALYCLYMILRTFSVGGGFLAVIWYILTAAIVIILTFGFFPARTLMALMFLVPVVYRLIFVDIRLYFAAKDYLGFISEAAALSGLCAFSAFGMSLNPGKAAARKKADTV